jgi:hypothetical protein
MNIYYLLCLLSIALVTGCANLLGTSMPEDYALYTDQDLRIYAETIDLKIQQALKDNDANQAQQLGRKRQQLIAEFNRRHLTRMTPAPFVRPHRPKPPSPQQSPTLKQPENGLPGEN